MEEQILSSIIQAVKSLYGADVEQSLLSLGKTKKEFTGDLTLVVFPLLKISRQKPEDTAEAIGAYLKQNCAQVADYNVIKGADGIHVIDCDCRLNVPTLGCGGNYVFERPHVDWSVPFFTKDIKSVLSEY